MIARRRSAVPRESCSCRPAGRAKALQLRQYVRKARLNPAFGALETLYPQREKPQMGQETQPSA